MGNADIARTQASYIVRVVAIRFDKDCFTAFLQSADAKSNLGDARCDECWSPTRGLHRCKKCGEKRERASFTSFLETPTAKTNRGDACCDTCLETDTRIVEVPGL